MKLMWWLFIIVTIITFVSIGNCAEFTETWQYSTYTGDWEEWTTSSGDHGAGGGGSTTWTSNLPSGYPYMKAINLYAHSHHVYYLSTRYDGSGSINIRNLIPAESTYWSVRYWQGTGGTGSSGARLYDKEKNLITSCTLGTSYGGGVSSGLIEFIQTGSGIYFYKDGVSQSMLTSSGKVPAYIGFWAHSSSGGTPDNYYVYFSDVTTKDGLVSLGTENGNINRTFTEAMNYELDMTWHTNSIPTYEYTAAQYDMEVRRSTWGEIYDTQRIKNASEDASVVLPYGAMKYNWSELFNTNHYGLYWFKLLKTEMGESETIGMDWLFFQDLGEPSTINIEETEYAIGETMNISYYIDDPDFGANSYKIQIFDATGQLKDERTLTMQADTEQMTSTIDWEEGIMYAVLVEDSKPHITEDPPEDIRDLAYDFCTLSSVIYITGKVYDASNADMLVDGTLLDNVSLNWTQAGTIYNTTSDANGEYKFIDATTLLEVEWFQDVPITVHAEKTGYSHTDFDMVIIKAGRYTVDIYMVPPQRTVDLGNASIAGIVADDIFHQCIPFASVYIWNVTWSNSTYTNAWGWYEFYNISNGTYSMKASKETYRDKYEYGVDVGNMSVQLEACDVADYNEATLDECDATTGWYSDNTLLLDTSDYIESTGSLISNGTSTKDFNKTFSPGIDSNITGAHGCFYLYAKVDNHTNISSANVTITISSNVSGATDKIVWESNKSNFNTTWDLHVLKISNGTETGTCNLSNITYFKFESTKSGNVITKIDFLAFVEYTGWESCVDLSIDTSDKQEGTGSLKCVGTPKSGCDLVAGRWWSTPFDASVIDTDSEIARLQFWNKESNSHTTVHYDNVYLEDSDGDYLYWMPLIYSNDTWQEREFFLTDATEYGTFDISSISWLGFYNPTHYYMTSRFDDIRLVQAGQTRQNFYLSQNYNLTIYAKDMDTRYTITSFTAILDSTTVAETTTGAIVFPNVTYGIYPLEVSANGYYTNKQYVFMGQDTTQTVYLTKVENVSGGGAGTYYAPHRVEFKVQNLFGYPVEDVTVSTTALATTAMNWDWLWKALGLREDVALEMENGTMNGTTDSHGGISFLMEPTIKYRITFIKAGTNINETLTVYPKDDTYLVIVTTLAEERNRNEYVSWNFSAVDESPPTHANLTFNYTDALDKTTTLYFFVKDENRTEIFNQTFTSQGIIDVGYIVNRSKGQSYIWGFNCSHEEFGYFAQSNFITFKSRLINLDIILPNEKYYTWISIALLIFIAGLFSVTVSRFGYVIIPGAGLILSYIGWLSTNITLLTVAMGLGILAFMGKTERDKGL